MAKNDSMLIAVAIVIAAFMFMKAPATPTTGGTTGGSTSGGVDLCSLVQSDVQFTAQRTFQVGTTVPTEWVKVVMENGVKKDLGYISLNKGTLSTIPNKKYNLYFALNATKTAGSGYYTDKQDYTAPCQDATDDKLGDLCQIGTPTITVFDEYGNVQSASANPQALTTNDKKDVTIRVRAPSRQCYGAPDALAAGKNNALCLRFNTSVIKNVQMKTGAIAAPYAVSSVYSSAGLQINCFKLDILKDTEQKDYVVSIEAQNAEPTTAHNISVYAKDIDMGLNTDTLEEIWDFQDQNNAQIGSNVVTSTVYVS